MTDEQRRFREAIEAISRDEYLARHREAFAALGSELADHPSPIEALVGRTDPAAKAVQLHVGGFFKSGLWPPFGPPTERRVLPADEAEILEQYIEHVLERFPGSCRGRQIDGIELVLLPADTIACVHAFLSHRGEIDRFRLALLGLCHAKLVTATARLRGRSRTYYQRVRLMAELVLRATVKRERARENTTVGE